MGCDRGAMEGKCSELPFGMAHMAWHFHRVSAENPRVGRGSSECSHGWAPFTMACVSAHHLTPQHPWVDAMHEISRVGPNGRLATLTREGVGPKAYGLVPVFACTKCTRAYPLLSRATSSRGRR